MLNILIAELENSQAQIGRAISAIAKSAHTLSLMLEDQPVPAGCKALAAMFRSAERAADSRAELMGAGSIIETMAGPAEADEPAKSS